MAFRTNLLRLTVTLACSVPSVVLAEPAAGRAVVKTSPARSTTISGIRVDSVSVPAGVGERTGVTLRDAVVQHLAETVLDPSSAGYSVSVSMQQLRRYVGPDEAGPTTVCIVDVALHDSRGALVGSLRGRASGAATPAKDVVNAAVHSAISRLPEALQLAVRIQRGGIAGPNARR